MAVAFVIGIPSLALAALGPLDLLGQAGQFIETHPVLSTVVVIMLSALFLFIEWERARRERSEEQRRQYLVDIERRRLSERNLDTRASAQLYHRHQGTETDVGVPIKPYVVASVDLHNIGDGPVDLLACLVSGRELDDKTIPGLATQARDVAWDDLVPFLWDAGADEVTHEMPLFRGVSTTKNITYAPEQLVRLDPKQHEELIRIDAITNFDELYRRGHVNLEYKIFTVALGYPLVDIRGPDRQTELLRLYALDLARPNYARWSNIERALDTINRFTFRLALLGLQQQEQAAAHAAGRPPTNYWARDPLGRLSHATAWRCFLLYHWEFIEQGQAAPKHGEGDLDPLAGARSRMLRVDAVKAYVKQTYHVYDLQEQDAPDYQKRLAQAGAYCLGEMDPLIQAWIRLNATIDQCTKDGATFAQMATKDPDLRRRWQALQQEGYLLTNVRDKDLRRLTSLLAEDPEGLLAIERYAIRTKYVLVTVKAPGHERNRPTRAMPLPATPPVAAASGRAAF